VTRWSSYVVGTLLFLGLCAALIVRWMRWTWSESVDVAFHYTLTARLADFWTVPATSDHSLDDFVVYPKLSHTLAALVGSLFNSPMIGIQVVALVSLVILWSAIIYLLWSLPGWCAAISSIVFIACLLLNRALIHAEFFGNEVIVNFFFPQLVAQTLVILGMVIVLYAEQHGAKPLTRYFVLSAFVLLAAKTHLLPAVVLLGLFTGLVVLEAALASRSITLLRTVANGSVGVLLIAVTSALVVFDPSFEAMKRISNWNGGLPLVYISSKKGLAVLCFIVLIGSLGVIFRWITLRGGADRIKMAVLKYVGLYGISVAGLCLLQIVLLQLGHGSEYAAKKYAFGLNTVVLLEIALLPLLILKPDSEIAQKDRVGLGSYLAPFGLIVASLLCVVPSVRTLDVARVARLERQIGLLRDTVIPRSPGKYDYAVNLQGTSQSTDFLISVGVLNAPFDATNSRDVLFDQPFSDLSAVGTIVTSEHRRPYDIEACRRFVSTSGLVLLDGSCVGRLLKTETSCQGTIEFTDWVSPQSLQGFSGAEPHGRWTDGSHASFMCKVPAEMEQRPTSVKIVTQGFVTANHTQRAVVSINGGPATEYSYSTSQVGRVIELPLPNASTGEIHINFVLPDAVSPHSLGMSPDPRNLGITVNSIEFK
jgi:hypothetical protein